MLTIWNTADAILFSFALQNYIRIIEIMILIIIEGELGQ